MNDTDAFFTHTIVGAPQSVLLGRRLVRVQSQGQGMVVNLRQAEGHLTRDWKEWVVSSHACMPVGQPRMRPGRFRRFMERHAFWLAWLGLASLLVSAAFWGYLQWI